MTNNELAIRTTLTRFGARLFALLSLPGWMLLPAGAEANFSRHEIESAAGLCLDNSTPTFHYAPGKPGSHDWIIMMQAGRYCENKLDCVPLLGPNHPSGTSDAPASPPVTKGILSNHPDNPFADWHRVWLDECNADGRLGGGNGTQKRYGSVIIDRLFEYLVDDPIIAAGDNPLDECVETGDCEFITNESRVLFGGQSKAGSGALQALDRVHDYLEGQLGQGVKVFGFVDATLNTSVTGSGPTSPPITKAGKMEFGPVVDSDCEADHNVETCLGLRTLLGGDYVQTRYFAYTDQLDRHAMSLRGFDPGDLTDQKYFSASNRDYLEWIDGKSTDGLTGYYLSCRKRHTFFGRNGVFTRRPAGLDTVAQTMLDWVNGNGASLRIESPCP